MKVEGARNCAMVVSLTIVCFGVDFGVVEKSLRAWFRHGPKLLPTWKDIEHVISVTQRLQLVPGNRERSTLPLLTFTCGTLLTEQNAPFSLPSKQFAF
jgi:hypothetical protein